MSKIKHENILRTYTTCTSGHKIFIVLPLMSSGSLNQIISYKFPSGIKDICILATILRECLIGLKFLQQNNLLHRDIKSGNILLSLDGTVCLGDFGVAAIIKDDIKKNSFVGSYCWMAPEVIGQEDYDFKIDIWSLGITAIEMAQGKPPHVGLSEFDIMRKIKFEDPPSLKDPSKWDPSFAEFIKSCLVKDPKLRPSAEEVLNANKKFFSFAKDKEYLKENLLKGAPTLEKRFGKINLTFDDENGSSHHTKKETIVDWNFNLDDEKEKEKAEEDKKNSNVSVEQNRKDEGRNEKKKFEKIKNMFDSEDN